MQISTKPQDTKPLMDATVPGENPSSPVKNISVADKAKLTADWNAKAQKRKEQIEKETAMPTVSSRTLRYELRKYGKHWQAYFFDGKKMSPLLAAPSILQSAMDMIQDAMHDQAIK